MENYEIKEKNHNHFDVDTWENWVEQSPSFFAGLLNKSVIGILIGDSEEQIILFEKKDHDMLVKIENPEDVECPVADIIFKIIEDNIREILGDRSFIKFIELISNQKIRVYMLRSQAELINQGYTGFLGRLGLNAGGGSCCCGGSC